jgi:hypothetical protein
MLKDSAWSSGSINLSASGDEVILVDVGGGIIDGLSWGNSTAIFDPAIPNVESDHSLERYPAARDSDSAADWRDQPEPSPGQLDLSTPTPTATPTTTPTATPTPTNTATPTSTATPTPLPPLLINEIHADPADELAGDANGDGVRDQYNDEYWEIVNTTEEDIDIGGWQMYDLTGPRHIFSNTLLIPAGCAVVVFGGGTPTGDFGNAIVQISSSGSLGLNNTGDTITLYDLSATLVDAYTYGAEGGDNQSITRDPDITGPDPLIRHSLAANANGAIFSPGTMVDGTFFDGCPLSDPLKHAPRSWHP